MLDRLFTSRNENQNTYSDILGNYAIVSSSEYSENNLILDIQRLTSLPINEQVAILNKNFPGLDLEPPKQGWVTSGMVVGAVLLLAVLVYVIKCIGCSSRKNNSQLSFTNPSEPSGSNQGQLLRQNMAEARLGDQSISHRRPHTRSMRRSQEARNCLNRGSS